MGDDRAFNLPAGDSRQPRSRTARNSVDSEEPSPWPRSWPHASGLGFDLGFMVLVLASVPVI